MLEQVSGQKCLLSPTRTVHVYVLELHAPWVLTQGSKVQSRWDRRKRLA